MSLTQEYTREFRPAGRSRVRPSLAPIAPPCKRPDFALPGACLSVFRSRSPPSHLALIACSDGVTRPDAGRVDSDTTQAPGPPPPPDTTGITQRRLIECPTSQPAASSILIGVLGGTVAAAGTSISLPAGSLLAATLISVTVPASTYMEVDITANGLPVFALPEDRHRHDRLLALPNECDGGEDAERLAHQHADEGADREHGRCERPRAAADDVHDGPSVGVRDRAVR